MIKKNTPLVFLYTLVLLSSSLTFANDNKIIVNGKALSEEQLEEYQLTYGNLPTPGDYWYDTNTGMFGFIGRPYAGTINPGHNFGRMAENSSNGNSGVYLNGRHLPLAELEFLSNLLGRIKRGRYWMDAAGNWGAESNSYPQFAKGKYFNNTQ